MGRAGCHTILEQRRRARAPARHAEASCNEMMCDASSTQARWECLSQHERWDGALTCCFFGTRFCATTCTACRPAALLLGAALKAATLLLHCSRNTSTPCIRGQKEPAARLAWAPAAEGLIGRGAAAARHPCCAAHATEGGRQKQRSSSPLTLSCWPEKTPCIAAAIALSRRRWAE